MKKSDLKNGMVVTYRNGEKRSVLNGMLMPLDNNGFFGRLDHYTDDLLNVNGFKALDIMKVASILVLWERK